MVFKAQTYLHELLQRIFHTRYAKTSPLLSSSRHCNQVRPTYHIVRAVHIAYHRYATGALHMLIRIGPDAQSGSRLMPLQSTFFREVVTEGFSFYALEEEPVIDVELHFPEEILSHEQTTIERVLQKEEETRFVFLLQMAANRTYHFSLVISYP